MVRSFREMFSYYSSSAEGIDSTSLGLRNKAERIHTNTIYLDSAATTQRLTSALDAMQSYYQNYNANVHRGAYPLAQKATKEYERARSKLATFLNAKRSEEVVFTSGATSALNIIANGLSHSQLQGNKIVLCISEHHANLLPWQKLAQQFDMELQAFYLDDKGCFGKKEQESALSAIDKDTAIVALAHVSNVLGNVYPVKALCAKANALDAISVIDGTQAAAHLRIDVQNIDCDFYVLSGHKMYAGTGIGLLYGKYAQLEKLGASVLGGEMITHVSLDTHTLQAPPLKFEAGTPNIAGAIGMAVAAEFCSQYRDEIQAHEDRLYHILYEGLAAIDHIQIWGNVHESIALISFSCSDIHAHDLSTALANLGIAVRAGQHCAMPLLHSLNIEASLRVSIACYNTTEEIEDFLSALKHVISQFRSLDTKSVDNRAQRASNKPSVMKVTTAADDPSQAERLLSIETIEKQLANANGWNEKHRLLLLHSKQIPLLALEKRTTENALSGCEAKVWLAKQDIVRAYSDSKVVRGLLSLLINKANSLLADAKEAKADEAKSDETMSIEDLGSTEGTFDYHRYLQELGLSHYFSQGRKDGMASVITRLKRLTKV